jgi:2,3-bisphosphoglycerate-independent phosphoglycerate mutase
MDRDNNWERIESGESDFGGKRATLLWQTVGSRKELYERDVVDEHLEPVVFLDENGKSIQVEKNDGVFFLNYRSDRSRQMTHSILAKEHDLNLYFVTMTDYDDKLGLKAAFTSEAVETTLSEQISLAGLSQAHIAETEKFAHVTFFFNGGRAEPYANETDILIPSRKDILTHDQAPKMMAKEIVDKAIGQIDQGVDFVLVNIANPDMMDIRLAKQ